MAVLLLIGLGVSDVVTYTSLRSFLYGRVDAQLDATQHLAVHYLVRAAAKGYVPSVEGFNDRIGQDVYVVVLSPRGATLVTRPSGTPTYTDPRPVIPRSVRLSDGSVPGGGPYRPNPNDFNLSAPNGMAYRAQAAAVPQGTVVTAIPLTQTDSTMSLLVRIEVGVSIAVLLALCCVALWMVRRGLRPLDAMAKTARTIASGDLSRRIETTDAGTEAGRLGQALNAMLAEIEAGFAEKSESEARLRQFVADASHELRTPLTSIRGYAELLGKGAFGDEEERLRALRRVEHEAVRMAGLVDDLLLLARLDQGRPLERVPVDLRRVSRDAVGDAELADPERSVELVAPDPVTVAGDRDRVAQVAHNLVRNALVHTPARTPVRVEVRAEGDMGVLRVADGGPGLTPTRLGRVFDRFYRGDPARTGEGTGLGLSIVRAIADALSGHAWAEPRPGGGTVFGVAIPLYVAEKGAVDAGAGNGRAGNERAGRVRAGTPAVDARAHGPQVVTGAVPTTRGPAPRAPGAA
jgi:two-component system OmpR family sensor kinase